MFHIFCCHDNQFCYNFQERLRVFRLHLVFICWNFITHMPYIIVLNLTHHDPVTQIWVSVGSENGLLSDSTKPLPELMLTNCHICSVAFLRNFTGGAKEHNPLRVFGDYTIKNTTTLPKGQWVNGSKIDIMVFCRQALPEKMHPLFNQQRICAWRAHGQCHRKIL